MIWISVCLIGAYLLGSIPTAVWIGKGYYDIDVREHGSKNAGATNTFRVLGKKPGIAVLVIDVLKGITASLIPVFLVMDSPDDLLVKVQIGSAFLAVFGHLFPVFAGFRGGKGVATSLGVVIGILPVAAAISMIIFLVVFFSTRFVSLGALTAALFFPFVLKFALGTDSVWLLSFGAVVSSMVIIAHRKNIKRLLKGEESKMNFSRK
jgi:glycerol-3-phosphate acyltransferase PlsY